jgi:RHS repeat-associated protein
MVWAEQRATDGGTLQARVEYSYDAFGNRIKRVQKNGSLAITSDERSAYDGWDTAKDAPRGSENFDAYADLSSANAVTMRRVYGADFDEAVARVASAGTAAWYLTDRQGSVRRVLDNSGTITGSRDFSAFGAITVSSGTGLDRYAYTAREWDSTLNLQYTRARMYDPVVGRFLREDPLGLSAGDENLFRYVGNAHTLSSDPSGLDWNTRFSGALRLLGGAGLMLGGAGLATATGASGVGLVAGVVVGAYGLDMAGNGLADLLTGEHHNTFTDQSFTNLFGGQPGTLDKEAEAAAALAGLYQMAKSVPQLWNVAKNRLCPPKPPKAEIRPTAGNCFPCDTLVGTEYGLRPIQDVQASDKVWAFDLMANTWKLRHVIETYQHEHFGDLVTATVAGEELKSTGHHPWWVIRGDGLARRPQPDHVPGNPEGYCGSGRWVDAIDLRVGDVLLLRSGEQASITSLVIRHAQLQVFNFQVDELHCYAVGENQILVHNNSGITGVTESEARSLGNWIRKLEIDGKPAIESVEAFGSRAGSTFRGRPPGSTSDLDIFVIVKSEVVNSPTKLQQVNDQIHELAELFGQVKKFPVNPVVEIDALATASKLQFKNTPFIKLGD